MNSKEPRKKRKRIFPISATKILWTRQCNVNKGVFSQVQRECYWDSRKCLEFGTIKRGLHVPVAHGRAYEHGVTIKSIITSCLMDLVTTLFPYTFNYSFHEVIWTPVLNKGNQLDNWSMHAPVFFSPSQLMQPRSQDCDSTLKM